MKKLTIIAALLIAATTVFTACNNQETQQQLDDANAQNAELNDALSQAQTQQDSLVVLLTEMSDGMNQILATENIISSPNFSAEAPTKKEELRSKLESLQNALAARRDKIAELEKKLRNAGAYSAQMEKSIETMKQQIAQQETEITKLKSSLEAANEKINTLTTENKNLTKTVETVTTEKEAAEAEAKRTADELNTCYFIVGNNKELKNSKVIEKKFLGKTKVLEGDPDLNVFIKGDKRSLKSIPLNSKKAKVMTTQSIDSYEIQEDANGIKTLVITNSSKFWEKGNFLIIQID